MNDHQQELISAIVITACAAVLIGAVYGYNRAMVLFTPYNFSVHEMPLANPAIEFGIAPLNAQGNRIYKDGYWIISIRFPDGYYVLNSTKVWSDGRMHDYDMLINGTAPEYDFENNSNMTIWEDPSIHRNTSLTIEDHP